MLSSGRAAIAMLMTFLMLVNAAFCTWCIHPRQPLFRWSCALLWIVSFGLRFHGYRTAGEMAAWAALCILTLAVAQRQRWLARNGIRKERLKPPKLNG